MTTFKGIFLGSCGLLFIKSTCQLAKPYTNTSALYLSGIVKHKALDLSIPKHRISQNIIYSTRCSLYSSNSPRRL